MVSEPWEFDEARALFEEQIEWARKSHRKLPSRVEFGAMLEVPSLAEMLDLLLPKVDFLSIGTNDLTQFLFAADRADPTARGALRLAEPRHPSLPAARQQAGARGRSAGACLRRDGRPAPRGHGAHRPRHRAILDHSRRRRHRSRRWSARSTPARIRMRVEQLLDKPPASMRKTLSDWARRHKVAID